MDAAVAVLRDSGEPMNTREMVKAATEKGYWTPTACKMPEQTLYGSIFREIKTKAQPRVALAKVDEVAPVPRFKNARAFVVFQAKCHQSLSRKRLMCGKIILQTGTKYAILFFFK